MEIVLISSFCTNLRIAKCSFTMSKLRFHYLAWLKNSLINSDFITGCADAFNSQLSTKKLLTTNYSLLSIICVGVPSRRPIAAAQCCCACSIGWSLARRVPLVLVYLAYRRPY